MKLFWTIAVLGMIALPLNAASVDEVAEEAVGGWKLEFTTPDGEYRTPIVLVGRQHDEFVAWYVAGDEPEAFSKVKLDGEELHMTIRPKEFGGDVKATLVAHLSGTNACAGTVKYAENGGDSGEFKFKGKRIDLSEFDEKEVWKIGFVAPDGEQRRAQVTVLAAGEKLYAWYSSDRYELPAKKMTMTGDQAVMSLTVTTNEGDVVDVSFRGTISGDRVRGNATWSAGGESGSFPFRGERDS